MRTPLLLLLPFLLAAAPSRVETGVPFADPAATGEADLQARIFFTSNRMGESAPCECPSIPLGGLAQEAAIVERFRGQAPGFWFDTGNRLFRHDMAMTGTEEAARRLKAILMIDAGGVAGLDAMGVGRLDLGAGLPYLQSLVRRAPFPVLSANLLDDEDQQIFQPSILVKHGDRTIGVTSVLPADTEGGGFHATDPIKAARLQVASLREQGAELVVVLSNLGMDKDKALARGSKADVILGSHSRELTTEGVSVGRAVLGQAGSRGKYLGEARWYGEGSGKGPHVLVTTRPVYSEAPVHAGVLRLVAGMEERLADPVLGVPGVPLDLEGDPRLKGAR
jgi:2',3'-cyclic-nucleotide 2'-phosphodiesterase (5'-nucleotidase family)